MYSLLLVLCSFLSLIYALPLKRDVWAPHITYPDASAVWVAGCTYNVTWNVTGQPSQITNPIGQIHLRHNGLTQSQPIAEGFNLTDGVANVTIPSTTTPHTDWLLVLFGDSGNWSPFFSIVALS